MNLFLSTDGRRFHDEAMRAWLHLKKLLKVQKDSHGTIGHDHPAARPLISAILDRYGWHRPTGRTRLCNLFSSTEELRLALSARMVRAFDLPSAKALEDEFE
jgi:hypothetical protein